MLKSIFCLIKSGISAQIGKTIRRPSRMFFGPFFLCVLALLRRPWLVPLVLRLLPDRLIRRGGGEEIFVEAGYQLFQDDRPEEAWLCLQRYLQIGRPSIEQNLLVAMCLYHGLGRFRDAMALLACANERGAEDATRIGVANVPFRILDSIWARHIGHLAIIDYVIKLGILEGRREDTILYIPPGSPIANRFLLDQIATRLRLVERPEDLPISAAAVQALHYDLLGPRLPDNTTAYFWDVAGRTYLRWRLEGRAPLFQLPMDIEARGQAALEAMGMPPAAWFVALHVREGTWDGQHPGMHAIRNAAIATYLPAIAEITSRGGWVIRIGDPGMTPLPALPNVIDYCHSEIRADWLDIYIMARCRFIVGTNSGPVFVPALYADTPAVLTNWWPAAERPWHAADIFVPKLLRRITDGRLLSLSETLHEPLCWCFSRWYLAERVGVGLEDSDPEIIRGAVSEMLARLDGRAEADDETAELRSRANRIYNASGIVGMGQLAREFLRRHADLIK
ncbi:MAG TPA: TIGR04372 family glycosyltransferase [Steroidobacteraceae bacterium]